MLDERRADRLRQLGRDDEPAQRQAIVGRAGGCVVHGHHGGPRRRIALDDLRALAITRADRGGDTPRRAAAPAPRRPPPLTAPTPGPRIRATDGPTATSSRAAARPRPGSPEPPVSEDSHVRRPGHHALRLQAHPRSRAGDRAELVGAPAQRRGSSWRASSSSLDWTIRSLATFLGVLFIVQGVAEALTSGIDARVRRANLVTGLLSIAAGAVVIIWPKPGCSCSGSSWAPG